MRQRSFVIMACGVVAALVVGMRPLAARADVTANARGPFIDQVANCTGELLVLEGEIHALIRLTQNDNGGVHLGVHFDFNAEGTGSDGTEYVYVGQANAEANAQPGAATEATVVTNGHLVSRGPAENGTVRLVGHLTVTPDGGAAVQFVKMEAVCQ